MSVSETSISLPKLAKCEKPTCLSIIRSTTPPQTAPDCETKPIGPASGMPLMKVVFKPLYISMVPTQLGPIMRIWFAFAIAIQAFSNFCPSSPISLKPPEMITTAFMPRAAQSCKASSVIPAGKTITARSTGSGTSRTFA